MLKKIAGQFAEAALFICFHAEGLDHPDTTHRFFQQAGQVAHGSLPVQGGMPHITTKAGNRINHGRKHQHGNQSQHPVLHKHHSDQKYDGNRIAHECGHSCTDRRLHQRHIVR